METHLAGGPLDGLQLPVLAVDNVRQGVHLLQGLALEVAFENAVLPISDLEGIACAADEVLAQQVSLESASSRLMRAVAGASKVGMRYLIIPHRSFLGTNAFQAWQTLLIKVVADSAVAAVYSPLCQHWEHLSEAGPDFLFF